MQRWPKFSEEQSQLVRDAVAGRLSRRELIQRGIQLGFAAPVLAWMMTQYPGGIASAQENQPLPDITASEDMAGKTIDMTILGIGGWPPSELGVGLATEMFKPYANETLGYDVNFSFEESPFDQLFQKAAASLSTGAAEYNIIISDSQWLGALAEPGWIVQLNSIIEAYPELDIEFEPTAEQGYRIYPDGSDKLWGFPQEGDTIALYVRQDLFSDQSERDAYMAANDGEDLPQTFEDWMEVDVDRYERIATFFHRPDDGLAGTSLQFSKVYDYISCYTYPFMFSTGGDIWTGDVGSYVVEGVLDSDVNAAALARAKDFLKVGPEGMVNYGIGEEVDAFTAGKLATCQQWAAVGFSMLNIDSTDPTKKADETRPIDRNMAIIVPPPGFKQEDGSLKRIYTLGGQPWVINSFNNADQMRVAIDFLVWWYQPETQKVFTERGGNPADVASLNSPGFDDLQPQLRAYRYMMQGNSRDFWHDPNYSEMLAAQQEAFSSYMTDIVTDPMQALKYAACKQQEILFDGGRTDVEPSDSCFDVTLG